MASIPFTPLSRFTIYGFNATDLSKPGLTIADATFKAQYNPASFSLSEGQVIDEDPVVNGVGNNNTSYRHKTNGSFNVEFFFDGTGASPSGGLTPGVIGAIAGIAGGTVKKQIEEFFKTVYISTSTHEARALLISYGSELLLPCKFQSSTTKYTLFDRSGNPLRATIDASFIPIPGPDDAKLLRDLQSADVTKVYSVLAGDTIYNIAKRKYDDESFYIQIAQTNNLKNYRKLIPGQQLILPSVKES
jgi:nucleoid-associated protein YgaU